MRIVVDPSPRSMAEIFDTATRARLDELADVVWAKDEPIPDDELRAELPEADAVVFGEWRLDVDLGVVAPQLRVLLEVAGGHHHSKLGYRDGLDRGLVIGSCAPAFAAVVAEMGLAMALASTRGVVAADRAMRAGRERWLHQGNVGNSSLFDTTVGFVGCGGIACELLALLAPFRVDALGYDPPIGRNELEARGFTPSALDGIFEAAQVIFVLAAPTPENRHLVSRDLLERLDGDQHLIVLSRAHLVDFAALTELSQAGRFRSAIDVFPVEPLAPDDPIRTAQPTILVPHLAGALEPALHGIGQAIVADLEQLALGRNPHRLQYLDADTLDGLVQSG